MYSPLPLRPALIGLALVSTHCTQETQKPSNPPIAAAAQFNEPFVVIAETPLRLAPSDDDHVLHPHALNTTVSNYIGTLSRGHLATIRKQIPLWSEVVLDDDAEGWVHTQALMPARNLSEATVLRAVPLRGAPSEQAPLAGMLAPGTLVFVSDPQGEFSKIFGESGEPYYVASRDLVQEAKELAVSHLLLRMHMAKQVNDLGEASEILDEARTKYAASQLVGALADHVDYMRTNFPAHTHNSRLNLPAPKPTTAR